LPIALPLLVGPGAITTTMIALGSYGILVTLGSILIVMLLTWIVMKQTDRIHRFLGKTGSAVIAQVIGVFIAAIAMQLIIGGIQFYYPIRSLVTDDYALDFGQATTLALLVER